MRISLRNLPKKGFNEPELKEFGKLIMLEWMSTLDKKTYKDRIEFELKVIGLMFKFGCILQTKFEYIHSLAHH